jgi:GTP pyrophosphokinase
MLRQFELVERVKAYDPNADEDMLNRAYVFSVQAHGAQKRASGDPYFSHPIEVAGILAGMKLDSASIVTGLLHDTVEDTVATLDDIERLFGRDIARLVDGVTKLSRIELQSDKTKQAENFRKLVLAMSEDIRVLLVKLADRLHNMRTLHFIKDPAKRTRIARETMEIYTPLAERIGIHTIKDDLEDLAFGELFPEGRASVLTRLAFLKEQQGGDLVRRVQAELQETMDEAGVPAAVVGREKTPFSIWRKMQQKDVGFEQLSDVMAFRIVVDTIEQCYQSLGVIHGHYGMVPGRFKDYISTPKPNGYRSLHTDVIGPASQRIEIQIRTREMHEVAEYGVAAHWNYKQGAAVPDGERYRWLQQLLDILEHTQNPEEFLENTKLEMYQDQVFVFTPKGDLYPLPRGATPVDFAYAVHSQVGDSCVAARVNGRIAPLRTVLNNGDQVEIVTSKAQTPNPTWERFVVTGKARARIRRYVRQQQRAQFVDLGKEILAKAIRHERGEFSEKLLEAALKPLEIAGIEDLYAAVGEGLVTRTQVLNAVFPNRTESRPEKIVPLTRARKSRGEDAVPIRGLIPGMALHFAGCCHPLPGDRIVGIVTTGKGVTIHTLDCDTLETFADAPERWLDVAWDPDGADGSHVGRVTVLIGNEPGSLANLTTVISRSDGNITNLKITNRSADFWEILVDIEVRDVKHLSNVIAALRASPTINSVERARG